MEFNLISSVRLKDLVLHKLKILTAATRNPALTALSPVCSAGFKVMVRSAVSTSGARFVKPLTVAETCIR